MRRLLLSDVCETAKMAESAANINKTDGIEKTRFLIEEGTEEEIREMIKNLTRCER